MKRGASTLQSAIDAARQAQRELIEAAANVGEAPSDNWVRRVSDLEARIFGLDAMEAVEKPAKGR